MLWKSLACVRCWAIRDFVSEDLLELGVSETSALSVLVLAVVDVRVVLSSCSCPGCCCCCCFCSAKSS